MPKIIQWLRAMIREARLYRKLLQRGSHAMGMRSYFQALHYLAIHYESRTLRYTRPFFRFIHQCAARSENGLVLYRCRINNTPMVLMLRRENQGDYRVAGELTDGIYTAPKSAPSHIYDCGANIGTFTLFAACKFPGAKLVCYEPDPDNLTLLKENLRRNNIKADIRSCGVWSQDGKLYYHPDNSITGRVDETVSAYPIPVEALRIRAEKTWVKLDIEGAEYQVIPALMDQPHLPFYLSIEVHFYNVKGQPLIQLLKDRGYTLHGYLNPANECVVFDAMLNPADGE
ncbi:MAG: FkbM family methyltransferase [Verrucomicrobiota bacterium]|nr:FkbM family methyltransferase [Verrucomicrobiota bacterium]